MFFAGMLVRLSCSSLVPGAALLLVAGPLTGWIVGALGGAVLWRLSAMAPDSTAWASQGSILQYQERAEDRHICPDRRQKVTAPGKRLKQALRLTNLS